MTTCLAGAVATPAHAEIVDGWGSEFIFGFIAAGDASGDATPSLAIMSQQTANITVEYPVGTVVASETRPAGRWVVTLPVAAETNWVNGVATSNAVRVSATADVSVVMREGGFFVDELALAMPVDALGTEFILRPEEPGSAPGFHDQSEILVVAVQDATSVSFDGAAPIALQRGQGMRRSCPSVSSTCYGGSIVTSNKPVAVTYGTKCANVPADSSFCEHLLEFGVPVSQWGTEVFARNAPNVLAADGVRHTFYKVVAAQDGTAVTLDGVLVASLARGQTFSFDRSSPEQADIAANNPILVLQYMNSLCDEFPASVACTGGTPAANEWGDPALVTLLSPRHFVRKAIFGDAPQWINLVVHTTDAEAGTVTLDGVPISVVWQTYANPAFSGAQVPVSGTGVHVVESPGGLSASLFRLGTWAALGWPAAVQFGPQCGDGKVDPGEQCDDGQTVPCDGCSSTCQIETCGNGVVECGEQCDLGAANGQATSCCTAGCTLRSVGGVCRPSAGPCDVAESCTGSSATCPSDGFASSATVCRASAGPCDVAENCTGSAATCPSDKFASSATVCRASAGPCDVAESCTGSAATCPADGFASSATVCRASAGPCDVAENCTGSAATCPADGFASPATVCRASAGPCDVAESCTGSAATCPADGFASSATVCRASAGPCDVAENCTGSAATCPTDGFASSATVCRASAGPCDVAESCTGSAATCPTDGFASSATVCRASAGPCDVAENCTGSAATCPTDRFASSATLCRAAAGECDLEETCSGTEASCPKDEVAPNGTPCGDNNPCNGADECQGGSCVAGPPPTCDDGNNCTTDSCDVVTGCAHVKIDGCEPCVTAANCVDDRPCTDDLCVDGKCRYVNDDSNTCGDEDVCNGTETCRAGSCIAGTPLDCDDGNACTRDICDAASGCLHPNVTNGTPCADEKACTADDRCADGVCGGTVHCPAVDQCHEAGTCDARGECTSPAKVDGTTCEDGDACTVKDECIAGRCTGRAADCDDANACTADSCDHVLGCVNAPVEDMRACDDADACTDGDACTAGLCGGVRMCRVESPDTVAYPPTLGRRFKVQCDGSAGATCSVTLLEAVTTPVPTGGAAGVPQAAGRVLSQQAKGKIRKNGRVVLKLKLNSLGRRLLRAAPTRELTVVQQTTIRERSQQLRTLEKLVKLVLQLR